MIKILFLINTLGAGGAEHALVNLANELDKNKYDVTLLTMHSGGKYKSLLDDDITYICKKAPEIKGISIFFRFFSEKFLYKYFIGDEHYDIVVSYLHGGPTKVVSGCPYKDTKLVTWLHNSNPNTGTFFKFWFSKKKAVDAYRKMDAVVGVSETVSKAFEEYTGIKTETIYNTNNFNEILRLADKEIDIHLIDNKITLCSVGRLGDEKGFDRLLSAVARLIKEGYAIDLVIAGRGPAEVALKKQARELEIDKNVMFLGYRDNPYNIMKASDIYVLSSRTEGLPLVTIEALLLEKPIVATDVGSTREVLGDDEYGLVVESSVDGIYKGIKKLIDNKDLRDEYTLKTKEGIKDFYPEKTVAAAERLFDRLYEDAIN